MVKEAGRAVPWMHKVLTTMNVRLGNVISDLSGSTGMTIVREILKGERDPRKLAQRRDRRVKASEQEIVLSLEGNWQEDALFGAPNRDGPWVWICAVSTASAT